MFIILIIIYTIFRLFATPLTNNITFTYSIPVKTHGFAMRLTVLTQNSGCHGKAQNPYGNLTF